MELIIPPTELLPFGLRAMKMVAMANGEFAERERGILDAAQTMFGSDHDVDALEPITPEQLADKVTDPAMRLQLLRGMMVMSMADGEADAKELEVVEGFRSGFGIESEDMEAFRKVAEGHLLAARFDVMRRFWARDRIIDGVKEKGAMWLVKGIASLAGIAEDRELAAKYRALGEYPEGTLGRAYYDFMTSNEFSMPGEKGSPPEVICLHDLTHVLGDFGTDPASEMQVTAFHCGYRKDNPFVFILFSMMQFNLGIRMTPIAETATLNFDPPKMLDALRRGAAMNADLTDGSWDYWADLELPLEQVRAKFNIPPKAV
jgi:tellurite resistance protein